MIYLTKHPDTAVGGRSALIRELARIIYDAIFLPGQEVGEIIMPRFEQAETENLGGYERAMLAAELVGSRILH